MSDSSSSNRRLTGDRRRNPRGGRRPDDTQGYAPLVLVAGDDADAGARCVAVLARLRFAVAPAYSVDEALHVMHSVKPDLVVARLQDEAGLRRAMAEDQELSDIPLIALDDTNDAPQLMLDEIRHALRRRAGSGDGRG